MDLGNRSINNQDLIQPADSRWRLRVRFTLELVRHSRLYILTLKSTLQMWKRTLNVGAILGFLTELPSLLPVASTHFNVRLWLFFIIILLHYLLNFIAREINWRYYILFLLQKFIYREDFLLLLFDLNIIRNTHLTHLFLLFANFFKSSVLEFAVVLAKLVLHLESFHVLEVVSFAIGISLFEL